jgi:hypothetical protein
LRQEVKQALQLKVLEITNRLLSFDITQTAEKITLPTVAHLFPVNNISRNRIKSLPSKDTMDILTDMQINGKDF